jgi:hypothetical protein
MKLGATDSPLTPSLSPSELSMTHKWRQKTRESRRDSIIKPRVARHELPGVRRFELPINPNGVVSARWKRRCNPVGVEADFRRSSQGSSCLATLGWTMQSLWDWPATVTKDVGNEPSEGRGCPSGRVRGSGGQSASPQLGEFSPRPRGRGKGRGGRLVSSEVQG